MPDSPARAEAMRDAAVRPKSRVSKAFDFIFRDVLGARPFFRKLIDAFGWRWVVTIILVYGMAEGWGEAFTERSAKYYGLDDVGLSAADFGKVRGHVTHTQITFAQSTTDSVPH